MQKHKIAIRYIYHISLGKQTSYTLLLPSQYYMHICSKVRASGKQSDALRLLSRKKRIRNERLPKPIVYIHLYFKRSIYKDITPTKVRSYLKSVAHKPLAPQPLPPLHTGVVQFVPVHWLAQTQLPFPPILPLTQNEFEGMLQSVPLKPVLHWHTPGYMQLPPFKHPDVQRTTLHNPSVYPWLSPEGICKGLRHT